MIAQLISFPISVILFIWMLRIKKDDPFPKGSVVKMLLTGALCTFGATIIAVLLGLLVAIIRIGPDDLASILSNPASEESAGIVTRIQSLSGQPTLFHAFISAFLTAALVEEGLKYLAMRLCLRKPGVMKTRMDAVVCAAIPCDIALQLPVRKQLCYRGNFGCWPISPAIQELFFRKNSLERRYGYQIITIIVMLSKWCPISGGNYMMIRKHRNTLKHCVA